MCHLFDKNMAVYKIFHSLPLVSQFIGFSQIVSRKVDGGGVSRIWHLSVECPRLDMTGAACANPAAVYVTTSIFSALYRGFRHNHGRTRPAVTAVGASRASAAM